MEVVFGETSEHIANAFANRDFSSNRQNKLSGSSQLNRLVFDPATCVDFAAKDFHFDPCFVGPCRRDVSVKQREKTFFWWWQLLGLALDRRCVGF